MLRIDHLQAGVDGKPIAKRLHRRVAMIVALLIAGCATADGSPATTDASAWRAEPLEAEGEPARGYAFPAQVAANLYENFSPGGEGSPSLTIELSELGDDALVIATESGLLDDSVEAVQQRIAMERRADGLWWVRERGSRFRCYRGARPGRWTTELCP